MLTKQGSPLTDKLGVKNVTTILMAALASAAALLRRSHSRKNLSSASSTPTSILLCSSSFKEHVFLHDWWLIKTDSDAHGKRLGIDGFTSKESVGIRRFLLAPIVKRHDAVTLQTADIITIVVSCHLDRSRTLGNSVALKVCNDFVFGFPYYWEEFAALSLDEHKMSLKSPEHVLLEDFPVTILHDICMNTLGDHENSMLGNNIFDDILKSIGAGASCDGVSSSNKESSLEMMTRASSPDEALVNHEKIKAKRKRKGSPDVLVAEPITKGNRRAVHQKSIVVDCGVRVSGPVTRSRSCLIMKSRQD